MRTKEEIKNALDKLKFQYFFNPSKKIRIIINELSFYQKNPQTIDDFVYYADNIYTDWLKGKRNKISKLLQRIKI